MKAEEFKKEMVWFVQFYEKNLTDIQTKVWYDTFEKFTLPNFARALKMHIQKDVDPRFPAIGKIYALVGKQYTGGA